MKPIGIVTKLRMSIRSDRADFGQKNNQPRDGSRQKIPEKSGAPCPNRLIIFPAVEIGDKPRKPRSKKKSRTNKRNRLAQRKRQKQRAKSHYDPQAARPQMWLTLLWHIGLRLPWCWKMGPSYSSEHGHLETLLDELRFLEFTLFCDDAGFVGYDFWRSIADHGHSFLIRGGGNVRLLKGWGVVRQRGDIVYCWPDAAMKKKQPPLVLRLLRFHAGRSEVYRVTNILMDVARST